MSRFILLLMGAILLGCSSSEAPKADTGAPATTYQMVPATTGGGSAAPAPSATPVPSGKNPSANPPSAGSD